MIFSSCQEDDPTPSAAPPSAIPPCGNISVEVDGAPLTHTISSSTGCDIIDVTTNSNGDLIVVGISFTSWSSGMPEWICGANFNSPVIMQGTTYLASSDPLSLSPIRLTFYNFDGNGAYENQSLISNSLEKNGRITITYINDIDNLIDGNFSFTGYANNVTKQISCTFSDVPFN